MFIILFQCLLDSLHPFAQTFQGFPHPGQALYMSESFEPLIVGNARVATGDNLVGLDGMMNPGLRADFHPVSNPDVADYSGLSGQDHPVTEPGASRNTHLRYQQAVLAYYDIVRNHDKIIDFCASLYPGCAESSPIDRGVGADFHVIVDLDYAGLEDFYMPALFVLGVPVSIRANHGSRVDNDPVAYDAPVEDGNPGVYQTPLADPNLFAYVSAGPYPGPLAYARIVSNVRERTGRNSLTEQDTFADKSGRMYSGIILRIREE
jgi:hypothetical protein